MNKKEILDSLEAAYSVMDEKTDGLYKRKQELEARGARSEIGFGRRMERLQERIEELENHLKVLSHFLNDYRKGVK